MNTTQNKLLLITMNKEGRTIQNQMLK